MMPVPSHLKDCVVPESSAIDEKPLDATVQCSCGRNTFQMLYPGHTHEYQGKPIPCVAKIEGRFFFLIKARCVSCGKENLLLDKDFHGWNGFVCHDRQQAALPRPPLVPWKCLNCGALEHRARIQIQTEGKEDFISETDGEVDADRWPDGFSWFTVSVECAGCGNKTPEWVSYETM